MPHPRPSGHLQASLGTAMNEPRRTISDALVRLNLPHVWQRTKVINVITLSEVEHFDIREGSRSAATNGPAPGLGLGGERFQLQLSAQDPSLSGLVRPDSERPARPTPPSCNTQRKVAGVGLAVRQRGVDGRARAACTSYILKTDRICHPCTCIRVTVRCMA